jgi:RimJ/RimL family protein N-acetyltransferase
MPSFSLPDREAPTLETTRLRLRGHRIDDFSASAAMWAEPVVVRYIGGRPLSQEEAWTRLLRYVGHWSWMGFGYWAVEEKATGKFIGEVGFADLRREIQPSIQGLPELGWVLAGRAHGKGYATEAVGAAIAWGNAHLVSERTVCLIHPWNLGSLRVAEKSGFQESLRTTYKAQPTILLTRPTSTPPARTP